MRWKKVVKFYHQIDKNESGLSLVEVLLAMTFFVLIISSITYLVLDTHMANRQGGERTKATTLAQEGTEAARSMKNNGWRYLSIGAHGLDESSGAWNFAGIENKIDKFTRVINVEYAKRDLSGNLSDTGSIVDFDTKKITSKINWEFTPQRPSEVNVISYFTNWKGKNWLQTTENDFRSGTLYNTEITNNNGGEVRLVQNIIPLLTYDWTFDNPKEYVYDPKKISVANSQAFLITSGGTLIGATQNPSFDQDIYNWGVLNPWSQDFGDPLVNGARQAAGGNPNGWVNINIPRGRNYQVGGFWQQSFQVNFDNPDKATLNFDWRITIFRGKPDNLRALVFIDKNTGEPVIGQEVWSSGLIPGISQWASINNLDVTPKITTSGTYYFKLAFWGAAGGTVGPYEAGFDNALITWEKATGTYPTDRPTIQPIEPFKPPVQIGRWMGFQETAIKNGGEIYYQLSDDGGKIWQYWDGKSWVEVREQKDFNTVTVVNTNILSFPPDNNNMMFKAFLESDGKQKVILDNVRIQYNDSAAPPYSEKGEFESSIFDSGSVDTLYNYLNFQSQVSDNTEIKFQIKFVDSDWIGPDDTSSTYFTFPGEEINIEGYAKRVIQYKAYLSGDGYHTPYLEEMIINYEN